MRQLMLTALFLALLSLFPKTLYGQLEKLSQSELRKYRLQLPGEIQSAKSYNLKMHLIRLGRSANLKSKNAIANAVRVAQDVKDRTDKTDVLYYAVPAMSELQRLADAYPLDGQVMAPVKIIAAHDEYEPGSFVVYPLKNLGKVQLKLSEFKSADGHIFPKANLDLKVVKIWYQNGNGWYSYFGDTELKLTPELLLNDEELIKVDTRKVQNYARLKEKNGKIKHHWLTPPHKLDSRFDEHYRKYQTFSPMKENFRDAKTLQPVTLNEGEFKQFFLTAHVTESIPPGVYHGKVLLERGAVKLTEIPVIIRVLPFTLPQPKTYANLNKPFLVASYSYISFPMIAKENGGDLKLAEKQYLSVMKNQKAHNQLLHMLRGGPYEYEYGRQIDLLKEAGMMTKPLIGSRVNRGNKLEQRNDARLKKKWYMNKVGHHDVFLSFGDEPGASWLMKSRPTFETYQKEGFKFFIAGGDTVFYKTGYLYDFVNMAKNPEDRDATRAWNELDHAWVAWYARQHIGPENPAFNRRQYGMAPYLANYSALCNYAHHFGPYNDRSTGYKPMVFAYGCYDGVLDTIQWEGFREGIDDIRYATLLKTLALKASKSNSIKTQYAGRKALQFLASFDLERDDLNTARLEMINHILKLQNRR